MIFQNTNQALSHNLPDGNGTDFTIAATAHAFEILSNSIYEYKIAAVVREICTNAFDSHREAGREDVPFSVTLPTDIHPYFEVEDFGIGMNVEDAKNVYTVYFASTKRATNNVAGGLGIGGKSVFAYTKQFNLRIRKDGIENTAIIYIGNDGFPRMDIIHTQKTVEPNGVKVSVPAAKEDFNTFIAEARFYLSFYPVKPTMNIDVPLCFEDAGKALSDSGYCYVQQSKSNVYSGGRTGALQGGSFYAVMGPVPYKVNPLQHMDSSSRYLLEQNSRKDGSLFVNFDIGELSIAASRETLSMNEQTIKAITEKFGIVVENIKKDIIQLADDKKRHPLDLYVEFVSKFGTGDIFRGIIPKDAHMSKVFKPFRIPRMRTYENRRSAASWLHHTGKFVMNKFVDTSSWNAPPSIIKKITVLCIDKEVKTLMRSIFEDNKYCYTYVYDGAMSPLRKQRLEKLLNTKIEILSYAELYQEIMDARRKNRKVGVKNTYAKDTIPGVGVVVTKTENGYDTVEFDSRVTLEGLVLWGRSSGKNTVIGTEDTASWETNKIPMLLASCMEKEDFAVGEKITFVRKISQNAKRLEKYTNAQCITSYFEDFVAQHSTELVAQHYKAFTVEKLLALVSTYTGRRIKIAHSIGIFHRASDEVKESLKFLLAQINDANFNLFSSVSSYRAENNIHTEFQYLLTEEIDVDIITKIRSSCDKIYNFGSEDFRRILRDYYPLLQDMDFDDNPDERRALHVQEYIKLADALHKQKQEEVVAEESENTEEEPE